MPYHGPTETQLSSYECEQQSLEGLKREREREIVKEREREIKRDSEERGN
jgi:hypothetical protein